MRGHAVLTKPKDNNVFPIRPVQTNLFAERAVVHNDNQRRIDPRRALIKFKPRDWRNDLDDVPMEDPVQHGLFDGEVDRAELARKVVDGQPISDREFLRQDLGSDASGHQRARFKAEKDQILLAMFHRIKRTDGYETAVCALFSLLADDPAYMAEYPATWVLGLFVMERELLKETFVGHRDDRRVDPAGPDSDEED